MTWDELNKKYPEARYEMDNERERAFLKDCYSAYETVGFADKFWSPFDLKDEDKKYIGKPFKVIGRCEEGKEWDLESLPAWNIEFEDGHKMSAYPEEIYLNDMLANGYESETMKWNGGSDMIWTKLFNVIGTHDLEGMTFARCTTYEKALKAKECLENNGFENMIDIVQDEIPVDVIEIDSQLLEL